MKSALSIVAAGLVCFSSGCRDESLPNVSQSKASSPVEQASLAPATPSQDDLRTKIFEALERRGSYRRPSSEETTRSIQLFEETLSSKTDLTQLQSNWGSAGFVLEELEVGGESIWVLKESSEAKYGRGIVVIRRSQSVPVMIQAPHSFFDLDTEKIAMELFLQSGAHVCFWNTVHRRVANLTEEEDSFLNALSVAFARSVPEGRVIQIHGFSQSSNDERFDQQVDLIISQGNESPTQSFLRFAHQVRGSCDPFETAVYPLDVHELGGTQNSQRKALLEEKFTDFIHCEMSSSFRGALLADHELLIRLGHALTRLELNPEID